MLCALVESGFETVAYMGKGCEPEWLTTEVLAGQFESPEEMKALILTIYP